MQTQISCPRCQTPFVAEIFQIIDVGREPELKQLLVSGALNVVQCPSCRAVTQVATPLLYHDPAHELFMVYVPIEMGLRHADQERLIGQLVKRAMDSLPPEQRRGYMLQPQTIISLQTLLEKVLETEGISREDLERQDAQAKLMRELLAADAGTVDSLIVESGALIDAQFFALMRTLLDASEQTGDEGQVLKLINLQAKLYESSDFGKILEKQRRALHALNREAKKQGGLSPELLLKHVIANRNNRETVQALVSAGISAFNYDFFVRLTDKIEKRQKAGIASDDLLALREELLAMQQEFERRSREVLDNVQQLLRQLLTSEDKAKAVSANIDRIDETFMYLLSAAAEQSRQRGDSEGLAALEEIRNLILLEMERQAPPEIQLLNQLLRAEDDLTIDQMLSENREVVSPELLRFVKSLAEDGGAAADPQLDQRLKRIEAKIEAQLTLQ